MNRKPPQEIIKVLADKHGVSVQYVRMVINDDRKNEAIWNDYIFYKQEHNPLLKKVIELVPFN